MRFHRSIRASSGIGTPHKGDDGLWRIDNVPICSTGIEYQLSSGPHTFTEQELEDAVKASFDDVAINPPRLKLGHHSKANELFLGEDEPAFGRVEGMKLSENKQTIIGSYVGTPEWLAKVLPVAYPSRSVDAQLDASTVTGKRYSMVITDVSLLGIKWPGCSVLEDLPLWYGSDTPSGVEINAAADVVSIRQKFYKSGPGKGTKRWIRGERFDSEGGYNLIVDEGDGEISRIPVVVDGDEVKFGDSISVIEQYNDKAAAASAVLAGMKMADPAMSIYASKEETTQGDAMDEELRKSLAKRLNLPEDATEEQIKTELAKPVGDPPADPPTGGDPPADPPAGDPPAGDPPAVTPPATPEPVTAADGTVTLDRETFDALKRGADLAVKHESDQQNVYINSSIEAAVADGRIPPARRDHWKKLLEADFLGGREVLDKLERNVIPVQARGSGGPGNDDGGLEAGTTADGLPEEWFPEIRTMREQAARRSRITHAKEG